MKADWRYLPESRKVIDASGIKTGDEIRVIARDVAPEDGPLLALAPLLLEWIESMRSAIHDSDAVRFVEASEAIINAIREAKI